MGFFNFLKKKTSYEKEENNKDTQFDCSYGVVDLYFPESERIKPHRNKIHLYNEPESNPYDSLQFTLKPFLVKQAKYGDEFTFSGECYEITSSSGTCLNPYYLKHGANAAKEAAINEIIKRSNDPWVQIHLEPTPIYKLRFRTYGNWGREWLCIVLDETSCTKRYIRRDDTKMHFVSWEEVIREGNRVHFEGHPLYDAPFGLRLKKIHSKNGVGTIRGIYGDWMQVSIPNAEPEQSGWIRWKDCNGILQGIFSFTAIY